MVDGAANGLTQEQIYWHAVVTSLHKWDDPDPKNHWNPHPSQHLVLEAIFKNDCKNVFVQCGRKWGKSLINSTSCATPDGFREIGSLRVGDLVFDETGSPTRVMGVYPQPKRGKIYRVKFSSGQTIDASGEHLWTVSTRKSRRPLPRKKITVTTEQMIVSLRAGNTFNYGIEKTKPLKLSEKSLPIHPYVLGIWLGDGRSNSGRISGLPRDIIKRTEDLGYYGATEKQKHQYYIYGLRGKLLALGLINNKHVPHDYLWASIEQRTELLRGLMDSDGWCQKEKGQCCFSNSNKLLSDAVAQIVGSLGMEAHRHIQKTKCNGKPGKDAHVVQFYSNGIIPFFTQKKVERVKFRRRTDRHVIVSIEEVPWQPNTCIEVESPSHLFLAGESFIPTHNTETVAYALWRYSLSAPGQSCYYICPEFKQAKEIIWKSRDRRGRLRIQEFGSTDFIESIDNTELRINFKNDSFIKIDGSDNFDAWAGISPNFIVLDEFRSFKPQFYSVMNPNRATFNAPQIIIGTPPPQIWLDKDTPHQYVEIAHEAKLDMLETGNSFHIKRPSWDNPDPMIHAFLKAEKKRLFRMGKEDEWWREYGAELVSGGEKKVFPTFIADHTITGSHVHPHSHILEAMYH